MKTVREVAEELNISRQAVYSKLTVEFKEQFTTIKKINNKDTLVIMRDGIKILKKDTVNYHSPKDSQDDKGLNNQVDSTLLELLSKNIDISQKQIDILQNQLAVKDQQIIELNQRLKEAQDLNKNNQILLHRQQDQPKMLEEKEKKFSFKNLFSKKD